LYDTLPGSLRWHAPLTSWPAPSDASIRRGWLYRRGGETLNGGVTHEKEIHVTILVWVVFALSLGACIGFILCSVMTISAEEQLRAERLGMSPGHPLEPDSQS